jgi:fatty-acyl-CoA synthase
VVARERHGLRRTLTIGGLGAGIDGLAAGLAAAGAAPERPIVCWLPNRLEWLQLVAAAARLGVPVVGLNTRYRADELRHALQRSAAGVLVAVDEFAGIRFAPMAAEAGAGELRSIVVVGADRDPAWADVGCAVLGWDDLACEPSESSSERTMRHGEGPVGHEPAPGDLLIAFTTSGTTGFPKLAVHDQVGVVGHAVDDVRAFDVRPGDRLLLDLPMCGTFGFTSVLMAIAGRAETLINERFDAEDTAQAIASEGVTHYNASDDMLLRILDTGHVVAGGHSLREVAFANFTNAAVEVAERVAAVGVSVSGVYGMSEVFALLTRWPTTMSLTERARAGGIPVGPSTELRVVDPDTGDDRPVGEEGELCVRGPVVLRRYLGDPEATAGALSGDGWFRTGDLCRLTGDGGFEFLARIGDSLRLRGFLVAPAEIEARLELHPAVELAQVVGAELVGRGQVAVAFVRLVGPATEDELRDHCAAGIANFKVPARIVVVEEFPSVDGPNGIKILKRDLRAMAADLVG